MDPFDLVIRRGLILDGSGNPWYRSDIGVRGGRIATIGLLGEQQGAFVLDADGLVVAPGFIDVHTHAESGLSHAPTADNYVQQGVTTVIGGNCGDAPLFVSDTFEHLAGDGISCNLGVLMGHNAVRKAVMGLANRAPTDRELRRMRAMVAKGMLEGALGLSTGLKYVPGAYAETPELVALARIAARAGGIYCSHLRDEGLGLIDAVHEAIDVGRQARLPVQLSHHKAAGKASWGKVTRTLELVDRAREEGLDVTLDQYPYTASCTNLTIMFPAWALEETNGDTLLTRLRDPDARAKIREGVTFNILNDRGSGDPGNVVIIACIDPACHNKSLAEVTAMKGLSPTPENAAEALMDLVLDSEGHGQAIYHCMSEDDVCTVMSHPAVMVASDGWVVGPDSEWTHPRLFGTFPRVLGRYAREKQLLPLREAVRKMTSLPAQRMGLFDRGLLRPGMAADLVVFDADRVIDRADWEHPKQFPEGIAAVIVNGGLTVYHGEHTGLRRGAFLRRRGA